MTTSKNLSAALALILGAALTGCAADVASPDDDGDGPGSNEEEPLPEDVDATGKYSVRSNFDLATNAPGKAGEVARAIIAATDDGDDPSSWILDQVINQLPNGTFKNIINGAKPFVAGYINDRLLSIAPDFVSTMVTVGNDFGDVTKNFGLNETLEVSGSPGSYSAVHTVVGAHFKINNVESDYAFADFNAANTVVQGVGITLSSNGNFTLADHKVGVQYGTVLRIALDGAIIPSLDPSASNLGELLGNLVDCDAVGSAINDAVVDTLGFGPGPGVFRTACTAGLAKGADLIYSKLADIDSQALEFGMTGTAKVLDKDNNNQLDTIQSGTWTGNLSYAGTPAPLAGATFFGARM